MRRKRLASAIVAIAVALAAPAFAQRTAPIAAAPLRSTLAAPASKAKVILLVGMPGSGKTTAAKRLSDRLGVPMWTSGDVIRKTIAERGLPYNAQSDRMVAEEFGRNPGQIGKRIAAEVVASGAPVAIVEGFRTTADVANFRAAHPGTTVVSIEVGAEVRHGRMLARGRAGEDNLAYLRDRDRAETRRGVRQVMRGADRHLRPRGADLAALDRSLGEMLRGVDPALARTFSATGEE